jgi:hypothetical protein
MANASSRLAAGLLGALVLARSVEAAPDGNDSQRRYRIGQLEITEN